MKLKTTQRRQCHRRKNRKKNRVTAQPHAFRGFYVPSKTKSNKGKQQDFEQFLLFFFMLLLLFQIRLFLLNFMPNRKKINQMQFVCVNKFQY